MFKEPDDFNGYDYFYVRLYWTGFGFQANIVEEYVLLSALLHIFVGLKRTWDQKWSSGLMSLTFITTPVIFQSHLFRKSTMRSLAAPTAGSAVLHSVEVDNKSQKNVPLCVRPATGHG